MVVLGVLVVLVVWVGVDEENDDGERPIVMQLSNAYRLCPGTCAEYVQVCDSCKVFETCIYTMLLCYAYTVRCTLYDVQCIPYKSHTWTPAY